MAQMIQVEIRTDTTHTMTWLDAAMNLKPDTALLCHGDPRRWTVVHAYSNTPREMHGVHTAWHVDGLRSSGKRALDEATGPQWSAGRFFRAVCLTMDYEQNDTDAERI